jgi:hypothetical protein
MSSYLVPTVDDIEARNKARQFALDSKKRLEILFVLGELYQVTEPFVVLFPAEIKGGDLYPNMPRFELEAKSIVMACGPVVIRALHAATFGQAHFHVCVPLLTDLGLLEIRMHPAGKYDSCSFQLLLDADDEE